MDISLKTEVHQQTKVTNKVKEKNHFYLKQTKSFVKQTKIKEHVQKTVSLVGHR